MNKANSINSLKSLLILIVSILLFSACGDKKAVEDKSTSELGNYQLEIVDSVVFNTLSPANLINYNELTHELLLESQQGGEVLIINGEGKVLSRFKPYVEGPNYTEDNNFGWAFLGRDELVAYGQVYFHLLTKSGDRIERIPYPVEVRGWELRGQRPMNIFSIQEGDAAEVLAIISTATTGFKQSSQTYMDSVHKVHAINIKTQAHRVLPGIPASSNYRTMGAYVDSGTPLMNKIRRNRFASVYEVDSKIFIHDVVTTELIQTLEIPEEHLPEFKPVSFGSKKRAEVTRNNAKLFSTGDFIILSNIGHIPKDEMIKIRELPQWWESPEIEAAARKYMTSVYMVFDEDGYLGELDYKSIGPIKLTMIGSENGYFWVQRDYQDERDYLTFLKVKVVRAD